MTVATELDVDRGQDGSEKMEESTSRDHTEGKEE
jgi:hypothetical protein